MPLLVIAGDECVGGRQRSSEQLGFLALGLSIAREPRPFPSPMRARISRLKKRERWRRNRGDGSPMGYWADNILGFFLGREYFGLKGPIVLRFGPLLVRSLHLFRLISRVPSLRCKTLPSPPPPQL